MRLGGTAVRLGPGGGGQGGAAGQPGPAVLGRRPPARSPAAGDCDVPAAYPPPRSRKVFAAAHVAAAPGPDGEPGTEVIDWESTHPVPRVPVGVRVRGGRGDGHLPARHGPVLAAGPGADHQERGGPRGRAGLRGRDRPARRRRGPRAKRDHRRVRRPGGLRPVGRGAGDPDGQPRAGRPRPRSPGLPGGLRRAAQAGRATGDPALARRGLRPGAARLLGQRGLRSGRRDRARADRAGRRPGRRHQAVGAGRGPGAVAAAAAAGRGAPVHRGRLQLRRPDPRRRRRVQRRAAGRVRRDHRSGRRGAGRAGPGRRGGLRRGHGAHGAAQPG